jgi:membrane fusion protein (multidrug efflux system)
VTACGRTKRLARRAACALGACAALAGCGGDAGPAGGGGFAFPPTAVEIAPVVRGTVADRFEAVGPIEAGEAVTIVSEIDAAVVSLPFREGDPIRKGDLVAQLDDAELRAELARTEALSDQQRISYERVKFVVESNAGAAQDLDDAQAALKVAEANVDLARARLAKTRVTAPFDGVIGSRKVSPGKFLRAGEAITELAAIREIKVTFSAPERYLRKLARGARVSVSTTAYPGYELTGTIDVVEPVLDPATRSVRVVARVSNPEGRFRPGMSADVSAILDERAGALTIPSEAVFAEGDQFLAYVVGADSTVTKARLSLGTRLADVVEVLEGLEPGMSVVRAGHQKLFPGAKVNPVTSRPPAAAEEGGPAEGEPAEVAS